MKKRKKTMKFTGGYYNKYFTDILMHNLNLQATVIISELTTFSLTKSNSSK